MFEPDKIVLVRRVESFDRSQSTIVQRLAGIVRITEL